MAHTEMTRYAFISHMEDYIKKLLTDPLHADTDDFLKYHKIDGPKALSILTKRTDPEDENSAILIKTTKIRDNGSDENGKRLPDTFTVHYKVPRKDYTKKMRNLYINLFESNIIENSPITEGAWSNPNKMKSELKRIFDEVSATAYDKERLNEDGEGGGATSADASGQFTAPCFGGPIKKKTMYITQEQEEYIKKIIKEESVMDTPIGNFGFDAPIGDGKKNKNNKFFASANDHKDMMKKSCPKQ